MPTGVYERTQETRKALSLSRIGRKPWNKGIKIDRNKHPNMGHFSKHSEEAKNVMKTNHKGMTGRKQSKETIEKIRKSQTGKQRPKGKDSYGWKGGRIKYLVRETLKRDNYTCRVCGMKDEEIMEVDHILEKALGGKDEFENLQVLCPNCHARKTNRFLRSQGK
ncbi:MAG TPA: HNH endonuclease signature motif containing protein [Candidatus Pelethenecus sp.]|nr:HNH endonuclease signature motif containing protein [Candidatus Pelethenecus sp.]